jgi:hypothetical protein
MHFVCEALSCFILKEKFVLTGLQITWGRFAFLLSNPKKRGVLESPFTDLPTAQGNNEID